MAKRLRGTALAKRRYDVAQMNLAGMTLREIGEKLGVNAATVCRDLEWVREEWRKAAVEDFDQARAIELARLNLVERKYWEAWNRSTEDKVTRIEAYGTPGSQCGATLRVANHDAERGATSDHDEDRQATYRWEKTETQSGRPSFLEGVLKCIGKRSKLLGLERRKSELPFASRKNETFAERKATAGETFAERKATIDDSLAQQGGYEEGSAIENCAVTLHAMCCVTEIAVTWTAGWPSHNEGMEICGTETRDQSESQATNHALRCAQGRATLGKNDAALQSMHCVIAMAGWASYNEGLEIRGTETRDQSESQATNHALRGAQGRATLGKNDAALQSMHCVIGAAIPVRLASLGAPYKARRAYRG